jgi:AraC-like DNA-binding protein
MDQLVNIIIWTAIIQGYLLGILFISSKEYSSWSNKLLGFFLLSLLFELTNTMLPVNTVLGYDIGNYFGMPDTKILFPVLLIHYVLQKLSRVNPYKSFLKFNYGVSILIMSITLVNITLYIFSGTTIYDYFTYGQIEFVHMANQTYAFLLVIVALVFSFREVKRYRSIALNEYSDMDLVSLSWLWRFIILLIPASILWGAELTRIYIGFYTGEFTQWDFVEINYFALTIFIYVVSYQAFKRNDLFQVVSLDEDLILEAPKSVEKSEVSLENELEAPLKDAMITEKLYLENELTIFDVAKHVGASSKKVSSCINSCFGANFSEWVNKFRVEEVKLRIHSNENNYLTIEAIGQESGFKSRSAMYTAFKKFTGESPAKLRDSTLS